MPLPELNAAEQRVLGCLLEKQRTVPASYPLTLNSLRLACNQTSSRDPVVDYDERLIQDTARALKDQGLLRLVWAGAGSRVVKYHQLLEETLGLSEDSRALITVLLLRGAQSPGELKTRTERLHPFADKTEVAECLNRMGAGDEPLVRELPPQRGQQDARWIHLLGPVPNAGFEEPKDAQASVQAREAVLAAGAAARDAKLLAGYDAIASDYADDVAEGLNDKPFDIWLLERVAAAASGPILDLGCGPGQITAFLADTGAQVTGLDFSPAMIARARADFGDLEFMVGRFDQVMRPRTAAAWGAVIAWYSLVHLAPSELEPTLAQVATTMAPGAILAFGLHLGEGLLHRDELFDTRIDIDWVLQDRDQVLAAVQGAGFAVTEWYVRSPLPTETGTNKLYVLAARLS